MLQKTDALGIFDSGVGGLTVVKALRDELPCETFFYLADTANLPYGDKSEEEIRKYSLQNIRFLLKQPLKALIIACHTAGAVAYEAIQQHSFVPVFELITPAVEETLRRTRHKKIGVLATTSTVRSGIYKRRLEKFDCEVTEVACPLLVPVIEENPLREEKILPLLQRYMSPLKEKKVDTLILGCTHYPLIESYLRKEAGEEMVFIDPARLCLQKVSDYLREKGLEGKKTYNDKFFVSGNPEPFRLRGNCFLNGEIREVEKIEP